MPAVINPLITDAGLAAAIAASGSGLQLAITHVALGAGQYTPSNSQTAMTDRREKAAIAGGMVSGTGSFRLSVLFPSWGAAAYNASEMGFYAGDPDAGGVLFAVYSTASGLIVNRTNIDYVASFAMQLTRVPAGSVTVTVDVSVSQAMAQLANHLGDVNPHNQYVRHDAPQGLSNAAKNQARRNLNAEPGGNHTLVAASRALTIDNAGLVVVDASGGSLNITLPLANAMLGTSFRVVRVDNNYGASVTVSRVGSDQLSWGAGTMVVFALAPGDSRELVSNGSNAWFSVAAREEGVGVGDLVFVHGATARPGTLKANGALLSRLAYPALFAFAEKEGLISEAGVGSWLSGRFSVGDGYTTFRIPDLRGDFIRCWDDGRGVDGGRVPGSWQAGLLESHSHGIPINGGTGLNYASPCASDPSSPDAMLATTSTGGAETRPRNIALLACIKY